MAQTPIASLPPSSDLVLKMWDDRHSYEHVDISALSFAAGNPSTLLGIFLTSANAIVLDGAEATIAKIIIVDKKPTFTANLLTSISGGEYSPDAVRCLVRGPAILKKGGLPTTDIAGDPFDMAAVESRLNALGITLTTEPSVTGTQLAT